MGLARSRVLSGQVCGKRGWWGTVLKGEWGHHHQEVEREVWAAQRTMPFAVGQAGVESRGLGWGSERGPESGLWQRESESGQREQERTCACLPPSPRGRSQPRRAHVAFVFLHAGRKVAPPRGAALVLEKTRQAQIRNHL